jgi:hypothetical protein
MTLRVEDTGPVIVIEATGEHGMVIYGRLDKSWPRMAEVAMGSVPLCRVQIVPTPELVEQLYKVLEVRYTDLLRGPDPDSVPDEWLIFTEDETGSYPRESS